jgi:hypothetical protein
MDSKALGMFMILPTIAVAVMITTKTRKVTTELFHNLAVCCWILANSIWMTGEFFFNDTFRPYATVFFIIGLLIMSYYYLFLGKKAMKIRTENNVQKGDGVSVLEATE